MSLAPDGDAEQGESAMPPVVAQNRALGVIVAVAAIYFLKAVGSVVVPVLLSILLAYALEPVVAWLRRRGIPRMAGAAVVYAALAALGLVLLRAAADPIDRFMTDLPRTIASVERTIAPVRRTSADGPLGRLQRAASELEQTADEAAAARPLRGVRRVTPVSHQFDIREYLDEVGAGLLDTSVAVLVVVLLTFLLLVTGDLYKRKLVTLVGPRLAEKKLTVEIIREIDRQIERFLLVRLLISVIVAVATGGGLWLIGQANAGVWGAVAGALNVLPFVGPSVAVALITIAAFLQFKALAMAGAAAGISLLVAAVEGNVLTPWLTSRAGDLNTVAVFVGVLFWGWIWDVWGLLLAVPIMVAIKAAAEHLEPLRPIGELLGR